MLMLFFTDNSCNVKDKVTGQILMQRKAKQGMYLVDSEEHEEERRKAQSSVEERQKAQSNVADVVYANLLSICL